MDVVAHRLEISAAAPVHRQGFIAPGEEVSAELMPDVEALCVNTQQPLHAGNQVWPRGFDYEMEMISHQAIGVHLPTGFAARLAQGREEAFSVVSVAKNILASISAVHHVIYGSGIFEA